MYFHYPHLMYADFLLLVPNRSKSPPQVTIKMLSMTISSTSAMEGSSTSCSVICRLDQSTEKITIASASW